MRILINPHRQNPGGKTMQTPISIKTAGGKRFGQRKGRAQPSETSYDRFFSCE